MYDKVLYSVNERGVAVITLNAPKRMNTMSGPMNMGVMCALEMAQADPAVAVVRVRVRVRAGERRGAGYEHLLISRCQQN